MLGKRTFISSAFLVASTSGMFASATDFFPLEVGNSWVYRITEGRLRGVQTIGVEAVESARGRNYFRVDYFGRTMLLRAEGDKILSLNTTSGQEVTFLDFGAPERQSWESSIDPCVSTGTIDSRNAEVRNALGTFRNVIAISYQARCADAGVQSEHFLPYIGLIRHVEGNITGSLQYDLVYSHTGATTLAAQQVAFTMALDSTVYKAGANELEVRLTVRNSQPEPLKLLFSSGQSFDLKIYNERGETAYVWSADKLFIQAVREISVEGERTFAFKAEVPNLSPGRYLAEGILTSQPRFSSTITFDVVR